MKFATYKGEQSLSRLVRRLFDISGRGSRALAQEVEAALLQANPHLRDLTRVPNGALIVVPERSNLKASEEVRPVESAVGEAVQEVQRSLEHIRSALDASIVHQSTEAHNTLTLLKSQELRALIRQDPELGALLPKITEAMTTNLKEADSLKTLQEQALAQLDNDLRGFMQRFSDSGRQPAGPEKFEAE